LETEEQRRHFELLAALMAGQLGDVGELVALRWFQGLTSRWSGFPGDRGGGDGWVGRRQWGR